MAADSGGYKGAVEGRGGAAQRRRCGDSGDCERCPRAATMGRALLFLLLLLLLLLQGRGETATTAPPRGDGGTATVRGLLAEVAPPLQALRGRGVPCGALLPDALPGFSRIPLLPRATSRASLALALNGAGCEAEAEAAARGLYRELSPPAATALLRGLAGLRDVPAHRTLPLLSSLARLRRRCALPRNETRTGTFRCRRQAEDDACSPPGEREAHGVLEWVPGVNAVYNIGSGLYFAFQGCELLASERALQAAEDLGYAALTALTGGGPVAVGIRFGLQPGIKAGVRALYGYFTADGEPPTAPSAHSGPVLVV
ncbi:apolipoprotein F [Lagopus leucura]|uniref:apolipoprotein F n=1 Tax=Lagopus leucura TaxID=30410 RepID=UPI001C679B42|nr:apolipoprotein F [Lagopus leucura]